MRRILAAAVAVAAVLGTASGAMAADKFRISLETGPNHVRNISMKAFVEKLKENAKGKLDVELYEGASLYKDKDVPKALAQGSLEMGLPGVWQLDRFVPNAMIIDLPMFYGAKPDSVHQVMDGPVGQELYKELEKKLRVQIIGRMMDLGHNDLFGTMPIKSYDDVQGKKVRIPGGATSAERFKALGANPVLIPWPDLPLALTQGTVDASITTFESVRSAKLWDSKLLYAFEDHENFLGYLPMVSEVFWKKASPEVKKLITDTWASTIDQIRKTAAERQEGAKQECIKQGMKVVTPTAEQLKTARQKLMAVQDKIVKDTGMDPELVKKAAAALKAAEGS